MTATALHKDRFDRLDTKLRTDHLFDPFMTRGNEGYKPWYSRLLSALALVTGEDDYVFASATERGEGVWIVVVTDNAVLTASVPDLTVDEVPLSVVPRAALRSFAFTVDEPSDAKGAGAVGWPGKVTIKANYDGLTEPISFTGNSWNEFTEKNIGPIWKLLDELRADLGV